MGPRAAKKVVGERRVDTRAAALIALRAAVDALLGKMLPSAWSSAGRGWQEHWPDALRAGFYASCDGLIALAGARTFVPVDFESIADQVFSQHLTPFVTSDATAPDERAEHEREVVLSTTMKLAKYLQAYGVTGRSATGLRQARNLARKLLREGQRLKTGWSYVLGDPNPAVVPTMEAVLGLHAAGFADEDVTDAACDALAQIDWRAQRETTWNITDLVMWLVAVIELGLVPRSFTRAQLSRCMAAVIASDEAFQHSHWFRRFVNRRADANDYYSANVTLLFAAAILRLVKDNVLNEMYIRLVEPVVVQVATSLTASGIFQSTDKAYFWEHAQAMFLLIRYLETMEKLAMPMPSGMFVSPRYFTTTRFAYDPKLAAVLMPFGPDWVGDVYDAFSKVIKAAKVKVWRADQEHTDDVIIQTIWRRINECRFVIADCTGRNPNVFYELGIAHTIGKPVFICAQDRNDIPFDVASIRSTIYKVTPSGIENLKSELAHFIEEVKKS